MERYSNSTREVAQDGRRGALMLTVSIKHPDAEGFIDAKMTPGKVTGANVSVRIDDEFMEAAINGVPYVQKFPIDSDTPEVTQEIDASALWKKLIHDAWQSAEPGVLFWDTVRRESLADCYADRGLRLSQQILAGRFRYVRMTVADFLQLIFIVMLRIRSLRRLHLTLNSSVIMSGRLRELWTT